MYKRKSPVKSPYLFWDLESMLDIHHELYIVANLINWQVFEDSFSPLFSDVTGRRPKSIRLMVGLLILKHLRNVSDEQVVAQFRENAYYQYFCGMGSFTTSAPCASSELVHFRHRIGESGAELILKESIRVNLAIDDARRKKEDERSGKDGRGRKRDDEKTAFIDSTVQEKNITFPTDSKLLNKIVEYCHRVAKDARIHVRQTYGREMKELKRVQRFRGKSHSVKKIRKADRRMRTIARRLVRELLRLLPEGSTARERLDICLKFVNGEKIDGHKIYSLHEPDVLCISKGKEHRKYEFGNKVSIVRTWGGLIIGALSFRNEYDGHTIDKSKEQVDRIYGRDISILAGDRGYRGQEKTGRTRIVIPDVPKASDSTYTRKKKHRLFRKRAGIEPVIGHCKTDHRLGRNFYKGLFGDSVNVMFAAAAYNFKRVMITLLCLPKRTFKLLSDGIQVICWFLNLLCVEPSLTFRAGQPRF